MIKRIFLDLDGVIRAWDDAVIELYKLDIDRSSITRWDFITECAEKQRGLTTSQFWDGQSQWFWENLGMTPEAEGVLKLLRATRKDVILLTSPTMNNAGWSQAWIRKYMPEFFYKQKYMIGPCKYICADTSCLLIDDAEKNIDPFIEHGGRGFLFPRPWNRMRRWAADPVTELEEHLLGLGLL